MRRAPRAPDYLWLILLAAIWGSSFMFVELALQTLPPLTIVAGRVGFGALGLALLLRARGEGLPRSLRVWGDCAVIAAIGNIAPFFLIGWGQIGVDSGLAAILMSSVPLVTAVLAHFLTNDERLTRMKVFGIAVGFIGVVTLIGPDSLGGLGRAAVSQIAIFGGACCYAMTSVYARRLSRSSAETASAGVLIMAAVMSVPMSLAVDRPWTLSPSIVSLAAVGVLGLLATAAASVILFRIVASVGSTFLSMNNYLVPLFGVLFGTAILGERLGVGVLVAMSLILAGIALTQLRAARPSDGGQ